VTRLSVTTTDSYTGNPYHMYGVHILCKHSKRTHLLSMRNRPIWRCISGFERSRAITILIYGLSDGCAFVFNSAICVLSGRWNIPFCKSQKIVIRDMMHLPLSPFPYLDSVLLGALVRSTGTCRDLYPGI